MKITIEKYSGEKHILEISKQGDLYRVIVDGRYFRSEIFIL